jgi:hypothetical protein
LNTPREAHLFIISVDGLTVKHDAAILLPYSVALKAYCSSKCNDNPHCRMCAPPLCALQIMPQPGNNAAGVAAQQNNRDYVVAEFREPTRKRMFKRPGETGAAATASVHYHGSVDAASDSADVAAMAANSSMVMSEQGGRRKLQQTTIVHDILIVYTQAAANRAGGKAAIRAAARDTVARTNKAYLDTGLNLRQNLLEVRLVRADFQAGVCSGLTLLHAPAQELAGPLVATCLLHHLIAVSLSTVRSNKQADTN